MSAATLPAPRLERLNERWLPAVLAAEQASHPHPWGPGHFRSAQEAGNCICCLIAGETLLGYFVAMPGVEEAHLLNLTVTPAYRRQGWAAALLQALALWARSQNAACVWLEVRASNARARHVYERHGFRPVAVRRDYYPADPAAAGACGAREDAIVMKLDLTPARA